MSTCVEALQRALATGRRPEIFNTDQGSQFTSEAFTGLLTKHGIAISMDGVGRAFDNIMVERLWRTVKYEDVYIRDYKNPAEARFGLRRYFEYYNRRRRHRSLDRKTPAAVYARDYLFFSVCSKWSPKPNLCSRANCCKPSSSR